MIAKVYFTADLLLIISDKSPAPVLVAEPRPKGQTALRE